MKVLVACILFLVMGLSLAPCCSPVMSKLLAMGTGSGSCCEDEACDTEDGMKTEKNCAACSPFFACGSCPGFTLQTVQLIFTDMGFPTATSFIPYDVSVDSEYVNKKWQPPKIS